MMTKWINIKNSSPTKDDSYCWVMNNRRGSYGFVAMWYNDGKYFLLLNDTKISSPALDVTHWYPLPIPEYGYENDQ